MKPTRLMMLALLMAIIVSSARAGNDSVPGWGKAGSDRNGYTIGMKEIDHGTVAFIKSSDPEEGKFGTLMQSFSAEQYRGERIRMSARIKPVGVAAWAGMWMRVDRDRKTVAFDNMFNRPITGSADWQTFHIVLDVPENSDEIAMGILLYGEGCVYWDDIKIDVVSQDVSTTGALNQRPTNLDFSK